MRAKGFHALILAIAGTALLAGTSLAADDPGRQLTGAFCTNPDAQPAPGACIQLSFDGTTVQGYTGSTTRTIALRPGVYWLTVTDNSTKHNFSLEDPSGADQDLTAVLDTPGTVTRKVLLQPGTWTLFCDADDHRGDGMYVTIEVGGEGQVAP